ncbi:MAG: hypothetical protein KDE50_00365 [Caldilineaceae bacterium]|nr:hypothetical protein [Caldilineaceae bacterium]MCB0138340.1 hypothetical protein [Caldilineaceae bacterium]
MSHSLQQKVLERWLPSLERIAEIEVVWLEGSLVTPARVNPGSDIDIRLGIADAAFESLWVNDRTTVLAGLGETLHLFGTDWARLLTAAEGMIVEIAARPTSQLDGLALYEWKFLLNRLPAGHPTFQQLPALPPAETWPEREELTHAKIWQLTEINMTTMANCPAPFYNGEFQSAKFALDEMRSGLIRLLYRRIGLSFAKRFKHFSEILPSAYQADLAYTYLAAGADPLEPAALAAATLRTFEMYGKHLQALSAEHDGPFKPDWYWRLFAQTKEKLAPFLG